MSMASPIKIGRIFRRWLFFLILLNIVSYLPHAPMHYLSWINYSFYYLLGILCLQIARKDRYLWDIFTLFSLTFFLITASVSVYFLGNHGLFGSEMLKYRVFVYSRVLSHFLLALSALHLVFRYLLWKLPRAANLAISIALLVIFSLPLMRHFERLPDYAAEIGAITLIHYLLRLDLLGLIFLFIYFIALFLNNRPNGAFLNFWAMGVMVAFSFDTFDLFFSIKNINVYGVDQYFAIASLVLMAIILFLRLVALHSESHVLREQLIFDRRYSLSTPVIIRDSQSEALSQILKNFLSSQNKLIQLAMATSILLITGFTRSWFVTVKIFLAVLFVVISWNIYYYIFRVRIKKGQILNR
ncbi:hypothetical protein JW992_06625 [candidate division KSB1 bacterium]|nr:hypothetical protein [candidate division KSB1 bacterium]